MPRSPGPVASATPDRCGWVRTPLGVGVGSERWGAPDGRFQPNLAGVSRPKARAELVVKPFLDACAVVDPRSDELHTLNAAAAFVFTACTGELDETAIAARLAEEAQLPFEQAQADVRACLESLRLKKLVDG